MIEPGYVRKMAQYNGWQNRQLTQLLEGMSEAELRQDRKAHFGSIFATLNHLLWGDLVWMYRFVPDIEKPEGGIADSVLLTPTFAVWSAERFKLDGQIKTWAAKLTAVDLAGTLSWSSGATGQNETRPLVHCITHMFNHQTHHRGQIHAMMTAAGITAPVSDLVFMPEDACPR